MKISPMARVVGVAIAFGWLLIWAGTSIRNNADADITLHNDMPVVYIDRDEESTGDLPIERVARSSEVIAVVEVQDSEMTPLGGSMEGSFPSGIPMTTFELKADIVIKGDIRSDDVFYLRQEAAEGYVYEEGAIELLKVGERYLVSALPRSDRSLGYIEFPVGGGITLITSPDQEAELVALYRSYLDLTPEASPDASVEIASPGPEVETPISTDTAVPIETVTVVPTESSIATQIPTSTPASEASPLPVASESASSVPSPTESSTDEAG